MTDTRPLRDENFTTIVAASSADGAQRLLGHDRRPARRLRGAPEDDHAEAIERSADLGALVVMLHPGLNNLPLAAADELPALYSMHAVEIYNHNIASGASPDQALLLDAGTVLA